MDIYEIINHRQSDRQYDPERPVEPEKIRCILEAARIAPSACNAQPWHFIVVDEPELRNQVADAVASRILGMNHFTKQAPVHILVVEERPNFTSGIGGLIKDKQFPLLDIGIAAAHITLAATAEGLGSSTRKPCVNYSMFPIRNESFSTSYWDIPPNRFGRKNENLPTR